MTGTQTQCGHGIRMMEYYSTGSKEKTQPWGQKGWIMISETQKRETIREGASATCETIKQAGKKQHDSQA